LASNSRRATRLGFNHQIVFVRLPGFPASRLPGFRATASTILNSRGFDPEVIEAALAHQDKNAIRRTYNRATYWEQRIKLMQDWANLVDEFRVGDT